MQLKMESNDYKDVFEGFPDFHSFPCLDSTIGTNLPEAQREFNLLPKSSSTSAGKTDASHLPWCLSQEIGKYSGERRKNQRVKRTRSAEMHNFQERKRRERIRKKIKALHDLIPYSHKPDSASTLDDAIEYLKALQLQVQLMSNGGAMWQASCLPAAPYSSPFIPMNPAPRIGMGGNCDYGGTVSVLPNLQLRPSSPVPAQLLQQICPHPNLSLPFVPSHPFLGLASSPVMPPFDTRSSTDTHAISVNQNTDLDWIYINN